MNIILPKTSFNFNHGDAVVEDGILYIYRHVNFNDLMTNLTYAIYGKKTCHYCKKAIPPSKLTIDHKIPRCFGGPTIPNNLAPSCKFCNSRKSNMFENEFFKLMSLEEKNAGLSEFKEELSSRQNLILKGKINPLPDEWLQKENINVLNIRYHLREPIGIQFWKIKNAFDKYHNFFKPIIISFNRYLLDGFNVCLIAKIYGAANKLQIIQLDNVVCMY